MLPDIKSAQLTSQEFKELASRVHQSLVEAEQCKAAYEASENETEKIRHMHVWEAAHLERQELVKHLMFLLKPAEGTQKVTEDTGVTAGGDVALAVGHADGAASGQAGNQEVAMAALEEEEGEAAAAACANTGTDAAVQAASLGDASAAAADVAPAHTPSPVAHPLTGSHQKKKRCPAVSGAESVKLEKKLKRRRDRVDAEAQPADAAVADTVNAALGLPEQGQSGVEADAAPNVQGLVPQDVIVEAEIASEGAQGNGKGNKRHKGRRKGQSKVQSKGSVPLVACRGEDTALEDVSAERLPGLDVTAEADAAPAAGQAHGAASGQAGLGAMSAKEKSAKNKKKKYKKKKKTESGAHVTAFKKNGSKSKACQHEAGADDIIMEMDLTDGPEAEADAEQPEGSGLAEPNGSKADAVAEQPEGSGLGKANGSEAEAVAKQLEASEPAEQCIDQSADPAADQEATTPAADQEASDPAADQTADPRNDPGYDPCADEQATQADASDGTSRAGVFDPGAAPATGFSTAVHHMAAQAPSLAAEEADTANKAVAQEAVKAAEDALHINLKQHARALLQGGAELGQAALVTLPGEGAAAVAAREATAKAADKLSEAAAVKAFRDICGPIPDLGCPVQYAATEKLVRKGLKSADAKLNQLATAKAPQWPPLQRRRLQQMAPQQATIAAQRPVARATQLLQLQTDSELAHMRACDARYVAARAEVALRPMATHSSLVPPGHTVSSTQVPSRPIMPSVEAGARAAARRQIARGGHVTTYGSSWDAAVFGLDTTDFHFCVD